VDIALNLLYLLEHQEALLALIGHDQGGQRLLLFQALPGGLQLFFLVLLLLQHALVSLPLLESFLQLLGFGGLTI